MIITKDITLLDCGQQTKNGTHHFSPQKDKNYLLVMCSTRSILKIREKQYYLQPFTFLLCPFDHEDLIIETQNSTAYRYMHLRLTEHYLNYLQQKGIVLLETHTLPQPVTVEEIWKILLWFMNDNQLCSPEMGEYALRLLMCLLSESPHGSVSRAAEIPHYDKLTTLRHKIYSNPENDWYIQDICNQIGISRPYFHKLYLAAFGTTCTQDVIASRIAYSKKLLATTNYAVSTVSQKCGFETDVYFMRQFKRHVGMTPTAYRRVQSVENKKN